MYTENRLCTIKVFQILHDRPFVVTLFKGELNNSFVDCRLLGQREGLWEAMMYPRTA
jgi:hypothetical protein